MTPYRTIVVTPAGRRRYLEVLIPYIFRERSQIDQYHLWVNTTDAQDIDYLRRLESQNRGFVKLIYGHREPLGSRTVGDFYPAATDPGAIYIKLDDDICYLAKGALRRLISFRLNYPEYFLVHANTVNTVLCSYAHQKLGIMGCNAGIVTRNPFCPTGWKSGQFAAAAHKQFIAAVRSDEIADYMFGVWSLRLGERCSINCCSWLGSDFALFDGVIDSTDDEHWLSVKKPLQLGRTSCVLGTALAAHFAYRPQRYYLENWTSLLLEYRNLASQVTCTKPHQ